MRSGNNEHLPGTPNIVDETVYKAHAPVRSPPAHADSVVTATGSASSGDTTPQSSSPVIGVRECAPTVHRIQLPNKLEVDARTRTTIPKLAPNPADACVKGNSQRAAPPQNESAFIVRSDASLSILPKEDGPAGQGPQMISVDDAAGEGSEQPGEDPLEFRVCRCTFGLPFPMLAALLLAFYFSSRPSFCWVLRQSASCIWSHIYWN